MSKGRPAMFESLEPPRGGLAGLRARIERDSGRQARFRRLWTVAAVTLLPVVVVGSMLLAIIQRQQPLPGRFQLARIAAGLESPPSEPMTIAATQSHLVAARRVPAASDDVVFYLVASVEN